MLSMVQPFQAVPLGLFQNISFFQMYPVHTLVCEYKPDPLLRTCRSINLCNNSLYTSHIELRDFLNTKQRGGDWESCQTIPSGWVKINGSAFIKEDGTPLCAMVLINGQHMFSCNNTCTNNETGNYNLIAPLNDKGEIVILGFCEGYASFNETISPEPGAETEFDIGISPPDDDFPLMTITTDTKAATNNPDWIKISGTVTNENGIPLCAMVLANGQHMFTCGDNQGIYEMEVPLDDKGEILLYSFCDGFLPFKETLKPEVQTK